MALNDGDRSQFFPAIEKKHGLPVSHWLSELSELGEAKYPEQIAYLRENHGFSQAHANAVVMHFPWFHYFEAILYSKAVLCSVRSSKEENC
jgi:hypothetical protein